MDDRTKGIGEETGGRRDEYVTGRADELPTSRAYDGSPVRPEEPGSAVSERHEVTGSGTSSRDNSSSDPGTHQIRAEIERTREGLSETIEAIQDRLRPSNVASNAMSSVRDAASDRMQDVADSDFVQDLRANPAPTIMIGIGIVGLAWWAFGREDHSYRQSSYRTRARRRSLADYSGDDRFYRNRDSQGNTAGGYSPGVSYTERSGAGTRGAYSSGQYDTGTGSGRYESGQYDSGDQGSGHGVGEMASRAGEYADDARRVARQTTRRAQSQLHRMLNENPLMIAAAAAAVGAAIGMALPETERENELMGEARDSAVENVQTMARDAAERVQNAATEAAERVQNVASEVVGLTGGKQGEEKSSENKSSGITTSAGTTPPSGTPTPSSTTRSGSSPSGTTPSSGTTPPKAR